MNVGDFVTVNNEYSMHYGLGGEVLKIDDGGVVWVIVFVNPYNREWDKVVKYSVNDLLKDV